MRFSLTEVNRATEWKVTHAPVFHSITHHPKLETARPEFAGNEVLRSWSGRSQPDSSIHEPTGFPGSSLSLCSKYY